MKNVSVAIFIYSRLGCAESALETSPAVIGGAGWTTWKEEEGIYLLIYKSILQFFRIAKTLNHIL